MKTVRNVTICSLVLCFLVLFGCGKRADESKPLSQVEAEAEKMDVDKLRSMALLYKDAIMAKKGKVGKLTGDLKNVSVGNILGDEAKDLKTEIDTLNKSMSALRQRFQVYYDKLKEKDGNLSGLEL